MRTFVIGFIVAIIVWLGIALLFVYQDQDQCKTRAVTAITWCVVLSFVLFLTLMLAQYLGWFPGHRLNIRP